MFLLVDLNQVILVSFCILFVSIIFGCICGSFGSFMLTTKKRLNYEQNCLMSFFGRRGISNTNPLPFISIELLSESKDLKRYWPELDVNFSKALEMS